MTKPECQVYVDRIAMRNQEIKRLQDANEADAAAYLICEEEGPVVTAEPGPTAPPEPGV